MNFGLLSRSILPGLNNSSTLGHASTPKFSSPYSHAQKSWGDDDDDDDDDGYDHDHNDDELHFGIFKK